MATAILEQTQPSAATSERFYRPELDALRFFAFSLVFLSHTLPIGDHAPRWLLALRVLGVLGVPVFFALSAYLITELLLREKEKTGTIRIRAFYNRRILRIWPLYFLVLFFAAIFSHFIGNQAISTGALVSYVLLAGNWYTCFHGFLPLVSPLWSISVEEQFYLLWPTVARLTSRRSLAVFCIAVWLLSEAVTLVLCAHRAAVNPALWTNSVVQFRYFAIGALVCLLLRGAAPKLPSLLRFGAVLGGLSLFWLANFTFNICVYRDLSSLAKTYSGYLLSEAGVVLILLGFIGASGEITSRPLRHMGKISYGLYVYHSMAIIIADVIGILLLKAPVPVVTFGIGFPLTLALAHLSYRYFEAPFLRMKERFEVIKSRPA